MRYRDRDPVSKGITPLGDSRSLWGGRILFILASGRIVFARGSEECRELGPAVRVELGMSPRNTSCQADSSTGVEFDPVVAIPGNTNGGSLGGRLAKRVVPELLS